MKKIVLLLVLFIYSTAFGQDWQMDTLKLKGKVMSLHYESGYDDDDSISFWFANDNYEFNKNGFTTKSVFSNSIAGDKFEKTIRKFDITDNFCLTEYLYYDRYHCSRLDYAYDSLGRIDKGVYFEDDVQIRTFNHVYDSLGRINKVIYFQDDVPSSTSNYVYNENNLLTLFFKVVDTDTVYVLYEYDSFGRKINQHNSKSKYIGPETRTWLYDNFGNLIEEKLLLLSKGDKVIYTIEPDGSRTKSIKPQLGEFGDDSYIIQYEYNHHNQPIHRKKTNLNDVVEYDIFFSYNERGDVLTEEHEKCINNEKGLIENFYKYDEKGNWILKKSTWNGEPNTMETQRIIYY